MAYSNTVLVANWSEERLKNEYEFKVFLRKRDRRELLLQRSRTLFSNLLKERPLAISGTYVLYGFNVQIIASDMPGGDGGYLSPLVWWVCLQLGSGLSPNRARPGAYSTTLFQCVLAEMALLMIMIVCIGKGKTADGKPRYGLALSSLVSERQVDFMQNINDGCLITLSPIITPCCRNTFVILSAGEKTLNGEKMKYGDEFFLRAENYGEPKAAPLYVRYTPEAVPGPADRMPIKLSTIKDSNCRWTTMALLPSDRLESLGSPIKTGAKLIIKNCVADKSLCVMNQSWMQTFFGPECGVTCRNYIDIHKRFTAENIFTLVSDVETKSKE